MLVFIFLFTACGPSQEAPSEAYPSEVTIGTIRVPNDKTIAYEQGWLTEFFESKGIKVNYLFFDSGTSANVAFASGDLDFAEMGYTNGVVALARGIDVELIWMHDVLGKTEALVARQGSGIEKVSDLKGKTVATPFSSTSHYSLMQALSLSGLSSRDINLLDMDTKDMLPSWWRGDLDAAYTWEPTLSYLMEDGYSITDSEQLAKEGIVTANIELVHKDFSSKYPELVTGYLNTLEEAVRLYQENESEAIDAAGKHLDLSFENAKTQMEGSLWINKDDQMGPDYLGTQARPGHFQNIISSTAEFLVDQKILDKVPSREAIEAFVNTSYIEAIGK